LGETDAALQMRIDGHGQLGPTGRPLPDFPEPAPLASHGPARVIAMCNQKGGVGKTTTTINLGAALAELGRRVLLVDFDPQGALSVGLGIPTHELDLSIYNLLVERGHDIRDVIRSTKVEGLDVVPANIDLSAAEVQLVGEVAREQILARVLRPVEDEYDVVLIDCADCRCFGWIFHHRLADHIIVLDQYRVGHQFNSEQCCLAADAIGLRGDFCRAGKIVIGHKAVFINRHLRIIAG